MTSPIRTEGPDRFWDPALAAPLSWRPGFGDDPSLIAHLPALFWLVGALHPRRVLVLGDRNGAGTLALCQAIDKLDLDATCIARPGAPLPERLLGDRQPFPGILRVDPRDEDDSRFDLILADARDPSFSLQQDWRDALAPGGVALVLGGGAVEDGAVVLQAGDGPALAVTGPAAAALDTPLARQMLRRLGEGLVALTALAPSTDPTDREARLVELEKQARLERDTRFAETAALTAHLEKLARDLRRVTAERDAALSEARHHQEAVQAAEQRNRELLGSTSWRLTRPIRWIKDRLHRR